MKIKINNHLFKKINNEFWKSTIDEFANHNIKWIHNIRQDILDKFVDSFECVNNIGKISDITAKTFFSQIDYAIKANICLKHNHTRLFRLIIKFYVYLWEKFKYDFFNASNQITIKMLYNPYLSHYLSKGYYFTKYNPKDIPYGKTKICLIVYNWNYLSTRFESEDLIAIKLDKVPESYADCLIEYIFQNKNNILLDITNVSYIVDALVDISRLKANSKYKNKDNFKFLCVEAMWIKENILHLDRSAHTLNNRLGWIRRFLLWLDKSQKAIFEKDFFEFMSEYENPNVLDPKMVGKNELIKLNNAIIQKASLGTIYRIYHVLFHLILQTEFRISQICNLTIDDIHCSFKNDEFYICQNTKTSHGRKKQSVITKQTWLLLQKTISDTNELRKRCKLESNKKYVFLKETKVGGIKKVTSQEFTSFIRKLASSLNLDNCSSKLLRNTHMTLSSQFVRKQKMSDIELKILSGHKNTNTTNEHYIESSVQDMLEITLGATSEGISYDPTKNVVPSLKNNIENISHKVEGAKGYCIACHCTENLITTCLTCKNFHTTPKYIPFFEKSIELLKKKKSICSCEHDCEDLDTKIKLLVRYLEKMYEVRRKYDKTSNK